MAGKASHLLAQGISLIRLGGLSVTLSLTFFLLVRLKAKYIFEFGFTKASEKI